MILKQLIKSLKLDYVNSDITEENFPLTEEGKIDKIFSFKKYRTSEEVISKMDKEGYRPANIYEMLAWAKEDWNGKDWVVALGSRWQGPFGDRLVPYLYRDSGPRSLYLHWFDPRWHSNDRLAAVRKSDSRKPGTIESSDTLPSELVINNVKYRKA